MTGVPVSKIAQARNTTQGSTKKAIGKVTTKYVHNNCRKSWKRKQKRKAKVMWWKMCWPRYIKRIQIPCCKTTIRQDLATAPFMTWSPAFSYKAAPCKAIWTSFRKYSSCTERIEWTSSFAFSGQVSSKMDMDVVIVQRCPFSKTK